MAEFSTVLSFDRPEDSVMANVAGLPATDVQRRTFLPIQPDCHVYAGDPPGMNQEIFVTELWLPSRIGTIWRETPLRGVRHNIAHNVVNPILLGRLSSRRRSG